MLSSFFLATPATLHNVHWDSLIKQASSEGILPALHRQVSRCNLSNEIPQDIMQVFLVTEQLNGERNQMMLAEAIHVATLLNEIGIQPVALKGLAYLLIGVYRNPACRYLADLDLLLPAHQLQDAIAHLYRNGYFESSSDHLVHLRHHHPGIRRTGCPHIELHHQVGKGICDRLLPASAILANARSLIFDGATFLIPSPTHLVNHLILHSQLAHPYTERVFPPLRSLVDLAQLQGRFGALIDWNSIAKCYRDSGETATLALHLKQAEHILGVHVQPEITSLGWFGNLRWRRRLLLNRLPGLRFVDPVYWLMSLFSRRLRLVPQILSRPSSWPQVLRALTRPEFYRNLFAA